MSKAKLTNYAKFKHGLVTDRDVYDYICKHSSLLDRMDPAKMVEMTQMTFTILSQPNGEKDFEGEIPKKKGWKFYRDFQFT